MSDWVTVWQCDDCEACLNDQPGFTTIAGTWTCTECGCLNDVSENNEFDLLGLLKRGIDEFCPHRLNDPENDDD